MEDELAYKAYKRLKAFDIQIHMILEITHFLLWALKLSQNLILLKGAKDKDIYKTIGA